MTAMQLYKFIAENGLECHKCDDEDVIVFFYDFLAREFCELLRYDGEEGVEIVMRSNYFGVKLLQICDWYDINIEDFYSLTTL